MLWTAALVLGVLWGVGLLTSYTLGGLIHVLLVLAILSVGAQLVANGRNLVPQKVKVRRKGRS